MSHLSAFVVGVLLAAVTGYENSAPEWYIWVVIVANAIIAVDGIFRS